MHIDPRRVPVAPTSEGGTDAPTERHRHPRHVDGRPRIHRSELHRAPRPRPERCTSRSAIRSPRATSRTATRTAATRSRSSSSNRRTCPICGSSSSRAPASGRARSTVPSTCARTPRDRSSRRRSRCSGSRDVAFVTLQIGSNDLIRCFAVPAGAFDQACVDELLPKISARLTSIVGTLRDAAGPDVPIVGGTYYDPLLVAWTLPGVRPRRAWWPSRTCGRPSTTRSSRRTRASACRSPTSRRSSPPRTSTRSSTCVGSATSRSTSRETCQWTYACSEPVRLRPPSEHGRATRS